MKIYFDEIELSSDSIIALSQEYKMFDDNFYLGATPCRSVTLEILKEYFSFIPKKVILKDNDEYYAVLQVDSCELIDKTKYKLELSDFMTLLNEEYDASELVEQGETTLKDIVIDICKKYELILENDSFYGENKKISWYDNTKTARTYIGYVAELNGGYAIINEKGNLEFKQFTNENAKALKIEECEDLTIGEEHIISRVVYDNGIKKWEKQSENFDEEINNTVYLDTDNVYITEYDDIENIFNEINNFHFFCIKTENCIDVKSKIGECINFIDDINTYPTITQINKSFNGEWIGGYDLSINTLKQQETNIKSSEENIKNIKTRLNYDEAQLEIVAQETKKITDDLGNVYTKQQINSMVTNAETGITNTFSEAGGNNIFRNTSLFAKANKQEKIKVSGKNITIENSLGNSDIDLKLHGYTKQDTRSGINPSPDYPSEIEVGTGSVEVKSTGKNLQDVNEGTLSGTNTYYLNSATPLKITNDMVGKYLSWSFDIDITNIATESSMMLYVMGYGTTKGSMEKQIKQVNYPSVTTGKYTCKMEKVLITEDMVDKFITIRYLGFSKPSTFEATYSNAQLEFSETTTNYEPYKESSVQYDLGDNFLAEQDYIENGILNKKTRHLRFAIADMNNSSEQYPGWLNQTQLQEEYPNCNASFGYYGIKITSNITNDPTNIALNTKTKTGLLMFMPKMFNGMTQTEIKEKYSDLIVDFYYEMPEVEQIQLETTGELKTFEGVTNISNDLECEMDVEYKCNKDITYEFWNGDVIRSSNENATSKASMLLQNGTLSQEQEVPNGNYSISFYYKKLIELANASVIINDIEYELDSLEVKQFYTGEQDSETKEYITQPINVTNGHIKIVFKCDTNNGVEVYDLMCNKGSVKLAYSQNQNETTTDTVNISKGITITSSVDDIKFKADYDGIRTLDNNGNIKTKFTDKGMETNEAKITEKAEITGLLFQEVDDQSWITKI